jgi:hypothetical protein
MDVHITTLSCSDLNDPPIKSAMTKAQTGISVGQISMLMTPNANMRANKVKYHLGWGIALN